MLFTLYGLYIRYFGGEIAVSTLVRLMEEFDFPASAVRAALSRLANQGWIELRRAGRNSFLRMTPLGLARVDEAAARIYRLRPASWDGYWLLLTYTFPEEQRLVRDELRDELQWWGFGTLGTSTWLSPHPLSPSLAERLHGPTVAPFVDLFQARYAGPAHNAELVKKGWNLAAVNARYAQFLTYHQPGFEAAQLAPPDDRTCFVTRCRLVHEYRKFLFVDPGLPEELLEVDWLGWQAFRLFYEYDQLLAAGAGRYFYTIFATSPGLSLSPAQVEQGLQAQRKPFGATVEGERVLVVGDQ